MASKIRLVFVVVFFSLATLTACGGSEEKISTQDREVCIEFVLEYPRGLPFFNPEPGDFKEMMATDKSTIGPRGAEWLIKFGPSRGFAGGLRSSSNQTLASLAFDTQLAYERKSSDFQKAATRSLMETVWMDYRSTAARLYDKCVSLTR